MDFPRSFSVYRYWLFALFWAIALLALSLISVPAPESVAVLWVDKVNHSVAYALLAFLLILALDRKSRGTKRFISFVLAFIFSVLWGGLTEFLQLLKSNRSAEGADLLADILGITIALALYWWAVPSIGVDKNEARGSAV